MPFIDFNDLKNRVTIEQAVSMLGLEMTTSGQQLRGACPSCKTGGDRALVVTPSKGAFYCFGQRKGGDLIALVAHIEGIPIREAAEFLASGFTDNSTVNRTVTVPQESRQAKPPPEPEQENQLEKVAARLLHDHQDVQALGLTPEMAQALGVGYDVRGVLRGRILFPLYKNGELAGFVGFAEDLVPLLKFPSNLTEAPPARIRRVK